MRDLQNYRGHKTLRRVTLQNTQISRRQHRQVRAYLLVSRVSSISTAFKEQYTVIEKLEIYLTLEMNLYHMVPVSSFVI